MPSRAERMRRRRVHLRVREGFPGACVCVGFGFGLGRVAGSGGAKGCHCEWWTARPCGIDGGRVGDERNELRFCSEARVSSRLLHRAAWRGALLRSGKPFIMATGGGERETVAQKVAAESGRR